jgi:hypothetical protein
MDADWMRGKPGICLPEGFFKGGKRIKERNISNINTKIKTMKKINFFHPTETENSWSSL